MRGSAMPGAPKPRRLSPDQLVRSLWARIVLLALAFALLPLLLLGQFREAEDAKRTALLRALQSQGRVVAAAIRLVVEDAQTVGVAEARMALERLAPPDMSVRLLFRPQGRQDGAVFLVAARPGLTEPQLEAERRQLLDAGVAALLPQGCQAEGQGLDLDYRASDGGTELLTSLTPFTTKAGCWAVVTSHSLEDFMGRQLARPGWQSPLGLLSAALYAGLAGLVFAVLAGLLGSLRRFRAQARLVAGGGRETSFRDLNRIPELDGIAAEFDGMVARLRAAADTMRQAAEDNAHAFKTPIATITQSLEPVRRALAGSDGRAQRSLTLIETALARLEALVQAARRMDAADAELVDPPRDPVNLSALVHGLVDEAEEAHTTVRFHREVEAGCITLASEDLLETALGNVLDNAVSFSPPSGAVRVRLRREDRSLCLVIEDDGPGAPPLVLDRMFERYVSHRPGQHAAASHFGVGLWITRRNITAAAGTVTAANLPSGGLAVTIRLPVG